MKIDIFSHILPKGYQKELYKVYESPGVKKAVDATPGLFDLDLRFRIMDQYGCRQVLTLGGAPPVEAIADPEPAANGLSKSPIEYYRMFYNDTAVSGSCPALMCAYEFFGPDRLLFGSDAPFDTEQGARLIRETIQAVEQMDIPEQEKEKIFEKNALQFLHLEPEDL